MMCRRCDGEGTLTIKLGTPDPSRDTHARYEGEWITYPTVDCSVCLGFGNEPDKPNRQAGKRATIRYE